MPESKSPRINSLGVSRQIQGRSNLALVAAALTARNEELTWEDFLNKSVLVGGAGGAGAHGLEIGNSERD